MPRYPLVCTFLPSSCNCLRKLSTYTDLQPGGPQNNQHCLQKFRCGFVAQGWLGPALQGARSLLLLSEITLAVLQQSQELTHEDSPQGVMSMPAPGLAYIEHQLPPATTSRD